MKKIILALGLGFTFATGAFSANDVLDQLNSQVINVLAPYQNQSTVAQLSFAAVETNTERALKVALNALYRKVGPQNIFELKIDNLSYNYGDGSSPITILKGGLGIDLTKLMPQDQLNAMIPFAAEMVEDFAKEFSQDEYGDAVSVRGVVTSTTKDADENYTGLTALISVKIDLTKLPEDKKIEDIIATDSVLSLTLNLKSGIQIDAYMVSNPDYIGFQEGQEGLKERLDKLLAQDDEAMAKIAEYAERLEYIAELVVGTPNLLGSYKFKNIHAPKRTPVIS